MACLGATSSICTGHTSDEICILPKTYDELFTQLEDVMVSFDGTSFTITWDTTTSYPTDIVRAYLRPADSSAYLVSGLTYVSRDTGIITLTDDVIPGENYRLIIRAEDGTTFAFALTVEIDAEVITDFPLGEVLIVFGAEEVLFGTEFVYE